MKSNSNQPGLFEAADQGGEANTVPREEEWKTDPDFPDYEFSNFGRARSYRTGRSRAFFGTAQRAGHISVELQPGRHQEFLHRIIARLFLGPRPYGMDVCHVDGNPKNNCVANLTYGTPQQNSIERYRHAGIYTGKRSRAHKVKVHNPKANSPCHLLHIAMRESRDPNNVSIPMELARKIVAMLEK